MIRTTLSLIAPIILAFILDKIFGDSLNIPHPIVYIGRLISYFEKKLLKDNDSNKTKFLNGILIIILVMIICLIPIYLVDRILPYLGKIVYRTVMLYFAIALKTLSDEAIAVEKALEKGLSNGQKQVARIVGRDTSVLDEVGVTKACIETVAENTSDGIIAPYFYYLIFGIVGAYFYKVANTFDSMIAYKNYRYEYFGKAAARLDDLLNLIPSRLTGIFAVLMSSTVGGNIYETLKVFLRDRYKHKSPNSAQCESAFAGALSVELMGDAVYEGKVEKKEYINKGARLVVRTDIRRSVKLMKAVTYSFVILSIIIKLVNQII